MTAPLVSVIVVSFNQARFLPEAIESVLAQDYPRLEVLVIEGGSSDGSAAVVAAYAERVRVVEAPGSSQAQAINMGFGLACGSIVAWLNSDDRYLPGAVTRAATLLAERPALGMVYGDGMLIDDHGDALGRFDATRPFDLRYLMRVQDYILQPAVFMRSRAVASLGGVDESLSYGFDWDLWIRIGLGWDVAYEPELFAESREHAATKTACGGYRRFRELRSIPRRFGGPRWSPAAVVYGLDALRRRWPVVLGAGCRADERALRRRWLFRAFMPVHFAVSRCIRKCLG